MVDYEDLIVESLSLDELDENKEILQTGFWGRFKEKFGWSAFGFKLFSKHLNLNEKVLVLCRRTVGDVWFCYVPLAPIYQPPKGLRSGFLTVVGDDIASALTLKSLFVRFDLPWENDGDKIISNSRVKKSPLDVQPPSTVILSLDSSEEEILKGMKSKTRYNIRLALKRGVEVLEGDIDDVSLWYGMYRETARRDRIAIHSLDYYRYLFKLAMGYSKSYGKAGPLLKLLLARIDGEIVAGNIVSLWGDTVRYLYGASTGRKRNLMPTYALQWEAIKLAKKLGYKYYDLFGIPPEPDPSHPMYGLYRFKTGFGGRIVHRYGCYDVPTSLVLYRGYTAVERWRQFYFKKLRKRLG